MTVYSDNQDFHGIYLDEEGRETTTIFDGRILFRNALSHKDIEPTLIVGRTTTLYDMDISQLDSLRKELGGKVLSVIARGLSEARGSGNRRWINTVNGISNFNINIILPLSGSVPRSRAELFDLQGRIAGGVAEVLQKHSQGKTISIHYPFHYLMDGAKVAGHLAQIRGNILRIGIGINTSMAPRLPENDDMGKILYNGTALLPIAMRDWTVLGSEMVHEIGKNLIERAGSKKYLDFLDQKKGDTLRVYRDDGTSTLGDMIGRGQFSEITTDGTITLAQDVGRFGTDSHIETVVI